MVKIKEFFMKHMVFTAFSFVLCIGLLVSHNSFATIEQKSVEERMIFGVHRRLTEDVSNALWNRWTPFQRTSISGVSLENDGVSGAVVVQPVNQGSNPETFQENFSSMVSAIVDRLEAIVGTTQYERLDGVPTNTNGIIFRPIFLQDPFDSSEDEEEDDSGISTPIAEPTTLVTPSVQTNVQVNNEKDEMVLDSEPDDDDFNEYDQQEDDVDQNENVDQDEQGGQNTIEFDSEPER